MLLLSILFYFTYVYRASPYIDIIWTLFMLTTPAWTEFWEIIMTIAKLNHVLNLYEFMFETSKTRGLYGFTCLKWRWDNLVHLEMVLQYWNAYISTYKNNVPHILLTNRVKPYIAGYFHSPRRFNPISLNTLSAFDSVCQTAN